MTITMRKNMGITIIIMTRIMRNMTITIIRLRTMRNKGITIIMTKSMRNMDIITIMAGNMQIMIIIMTGNMWGMSTIIITATIMQTRCLQAGDVRR